MKHRLLRANELLQRELGALVQREVSFGGPLVTVHQVNVTPDLRKAHVYVSAVGSGIEPDAIIARLLDSRKHLQNELSKRVVLKFTPILHFHYDQSIERGSRVVDLLTKLEADGGGLPPPTESPDSGDDDDLIEPELPPEIPRDLRSARPRSK